MARDLFNIDGDKLSFHPERIKQWMSSRGDWEKAKKVYPIYVEISPSGSCNHRCTFCCVDYLGYVKEFIPTNVLKKSISEMGELGVKSVMYAGEGEPLLHKDLSSIIQHTKKSGIDVSITTNGTPLTEKFVSEALASISWIKTSINAGTAESYAKIHQTRERDFERVFQNLTKAVEIREKFGLKHSDHSLGAQMLLLPETASEILLLARRAKETGLDYVVIKPYSQHRKSITRIYEGMSYEDYLTMEEDLEKLNDENFEVIFRKRTMKELSQPKQKYAKCLSTPNFWAYIMANGSVYGCSAYLKDDKFCYGNINEQTFGEIWEGDKRRRNWEYVEKELDISECRRNCRMHKVNEKLWDLEQKSTSIEKIEEVSRTQAEPPHKNFI